MSQRDKPNTTSNLATKHALGVARELLPLVVNKLSCLKLIGSKVMNNKHKRLLRGEKQDILLAWILVPVMIAALHYFVKALFFP